MNSCRLITEMVADDKTETTCHTFNRVADARGAVKDSVRYLKAAGYKVVAGNRRTVGIRLAHPATDAVFTLLLEAA